MPCIDEVCLTCNSLHEEMKMSSGEVRKVSRQDIQLVQNLIERCLQLYMNQKEVVDTLLKQAKIEPGFTELVWQKLEEENREFFKAYQVRLMLKNQIVVFNRLLEKQVELMRKVGPSGIVSGPFSNGSNTSTWVGGKFMVDAPFALGGGRRDGLRREPVTGFPYISTSQYHQVRALHATGRVVSESEKVIRAVVANRPLSPHLALKKPQLSATYSISHRIFGAAVASLILASPVLVKFSVMFDV